MRLLLVRPGTRLSHDAVFPERLAVVCGVDDERVVEVSHPPGLLEEHADPLVHDGHFARVLGLYVAQFLLRQVALHISGHGINEVFARIIWTIHPIVWLRWIPRLVRVKAVQPQENPIPTALPLQPLDSRLDRLRDEMVLVAPPPVPAGDVSEILLEAGLPQRIRLVPAQLVVGVQIHRNGRIHDERIVLLTPNEPDRIEPAPPVRARLVQMVHVRDQRGREPLIPQELRERALRRLERLPSHKWKRVPSRPERMPSRSRGQPLGIRLFEQRRVSREPIYVRRTDPRIAVTTEMIGPQTVRDDHDNVHRVFRLHLILRCRAAINAWMRRCVDA